ncbi:MAG: xylose isomerase domain-containing protein [Candidatus Bathyarchaeota archaeon B26-1]|nr:MAG: xylose isomerase domain-containing protein [Candidatus Bathyarchaeota archaeon B26-1]
MKLGFMTFVCPSWSIERIVRFARKAGYDGVEIRVDAGHKHGVSSKSSKEERRRVRRLFESEGVEVSSIATSVQFSFPDPEKRRENIEAAKLNIELAGDLGAKVVRIFAGRNVEELTDEVAGYVAEAFTEVGEYAKDYGVCPLLETLHDIVRSADDALKVLRRVETSNFGILWNHSEIDQRSFNLLKDHIRHFHVHEEVLDPENKNVLHLARMMKTVNFDGYVSLEIIRGEDLPEDLLIETGERLKRYIEEGFRG